VVDLDCLFLYMFHICIVISLYTPIEIKISAKHDLGRDFFIYFLT